MTPQERVIVDAYLARDPLVRAMREADRHVTIERSPATNLAGRVLDPLYASIMCPGCLPAVYARMAVASLVTPGGVFSCQQCRQPIPVVAEDMDDIRQL